MLVKRQSIRITKKQIHKVRETDQQRKSISSYKSKKTITPGPWTNIPTDLRVNIKLREGKDIFGKPVRGTYSNVNNWNEKGWYPIVFNILCGNIKEDIEKHGESVYLAACEKSLNNNEMLKEFGNIIILKVLANHAVELERPDNDRFISCYGKTNKKNIKGFAVYSRGNYKIL